MGLFSGARAAARDLAGALLPLSVRDLEREIAARMARAPLQLNEYGFDPFGFHPETAARTAVLPLLLYRHWFRAETHGIDKVPQGRVMLICNHAGQMPYDGLMVTMAMLMEAEPPRLSQLRFR